MAINSIPQQEVANGNGQIEFLRAKPIALSNVVAKSPGDENPSGGSVFMCIEELMSYGVTKLFF